MLRECVRSAYRRTEAMTVETIEFLRLCYWVMGGVGTLVVIALLVFGAEHDFGHDADIDIGHDIDLHAEGDLGHGHDMGEGEGGPSPVSIRTMMAFLGGWGWGGLIGLDGLSWGVMSLPFGALVGFAMALAVYYFMRFLHQQEATSTIGIAHLIGQDGVVLTAIPAGGMGEVRVNVRGTAVKSLARVSNPDEHVAAGATVRVVEQIGSTLIVRAV